MKLAAEPLRDMYKVKLILAYQMRRGPFSNVVTYLPKRVCSTADASEQHRDIVPTDSRSSCGATSRVLVSGALIKGYQMKLKCRIHRVPCICW